MVGSSMKDCMKRLLEEKNGIAAGSAQVGRFVEW